MSLQPYKPKPSQGARDKRAKHFGALAKLVGSLQKHKQGSRLAKVSNELAAALGAARRGRKANQAETRSVAPAAFGTTVRTRAATANPNPVIPFESNSLYVSKYTDPNSIVTVGFTSDPTSALSKTNIQIYPQQNTALQDEVSGMFGPSVPFLMTAYEKWRVTGLSLEFIPLSSSAEHGALLFGYSPDTAISLAPASAISPNSINALSNNNMQVNVWGRDTLRCRNMPAGWLWTGLSGAAGTATSADQRSVCAGRLLISQIGLAPHAVVGSRVCIGTVRLKGVIHFNTLSVQNALHDSSSLAQPETGTVDQTGYDATAAMAFGSAEAGPLVVTGLAQEMEFAQESPAVITVRKTGLYRFQFQWSSITGTITGGGSATAFMNDGAVGDKFGDLFSATPPCPGEFFLALWCPDAISNAVINIDGPGTMTSGQVHVRITRLSSDSSQALAALAQSRARAQPGTAPASSSSAVVRSNLSTPELLPSTLTSSTVLARALTRLVLNK
jgi:hypothetical protein